MSLDAALAAIPALVEEVRALRREVGELRAAIVSERGRWVTIREYGEAKHVSRDTVERKIAAGELKVDRVRPDTLSEKTGRRRRTLRIWLEPPIGEPEIRAIAAEMRAS